MKSAEREPHFFRLRRVGDDVKRTRALDKAHRAPEPAFAVDGKIFSLVREEHDWHFPCAPGGKILCLTALYVI